VSLRRARSKWNFAIWGGRLSIDPQRIGDSSGDLTRELLCNENLNNDKLQATEEKRKKRNETGIGGARLQLTKQYAASSSAARSRNVKQYVSKYLVSISADVAPPVSAATTLIRRTRPPMRSIVESRDWNRSSHLAAITFSLS